MIILSSSDKFQADALGASDTIELPCRDVWLIPAFGNVGVVNCGDEGLVIFDIAQPAFEKKIFNDIRKFTDKPVKYLIFSHGHFDHAFGFRVFLKEIEEKGWKKPQIIAHENCIKRFEKYKMMDGHQNFINSQQFAALTQKGVRRVVFPETSLDPTIIIRDNENYSFKLGSFTFELYPEWGETDDAIWMYLPEKKVIFSGDLIISHYPNVGNPYKVQRYPKHWALAMERMLQKKAEYLIPGHGALIEGPENIKECLTITAEAMHFVHDEVVKRLNQGKWFEELYHEMLEIYPKKFEKSKWLRPVYGCYRFAIHAVYRLYHGWYNSGNPTDLFPSKSADIANELLKIAGSNSEDRYFEHAKKLFEDGKLQLALHILDVIIKGTDTQNKEMLLRSYSLKRKILKKQANLETSFIVKNILNNGAIQIKNKIKEIKKS